MKEIHLRALREISRDGQLSQRDLSTRLEVSLGMVNFVIRSLLEKGYIKARRFKNSRNKMAYMYVLTPQGLQHKLEITRRFIAAKTSEYQRLREEIRDLEEELAEAPATVDDDTLSHQP
jgi:EPS-associated MarR family transcriptional regulator